MGYPKLSEDIERRRDDSQRSTRATKGHSKPKYAPAPSREPVAGDGKPQMLVEAGDTEEARRERLELAYLLAAQTLERATKQAPTPTKTTKKKTKKKTKAKRKSGPKKRDAGQSKRALANSGEIFSLPSSEDARTSDNARLQRKKR